MDLLLESGGERDGRGRVEKGVAVGCRLRHEIGSDVAIRPDPVVDDDRRAQRRPHLRCDEACDLVRCATRGEGNDQLDRLAGPFVLRGCGQRQAAPQDGGPHPLADMSSGGLHDCLSINEDVSVTGSGRTSPAPGGPPPCRGLGRWPRACPAHP